MSLGRWGGRNPTDIIIDGQERHNKIADHLFVMTAYSQQCKECLRKWFM